MKYRAPIFVQAGFGKNAQPIKELCARWDLYGKTLNMLTDGKLQKIIVFLPLSSDSEDLPHFQNLELHFIQDTFFGRLLLLIKLRKRINAIQPSLVTLIAGDLYVSPLVARILRLFSKGSIKIQIQFHGATYINQSRGLLRKLKYSLMKIAVSSSDSIRIVSGFQQHEIQAIAGPKSKDFVVCPIPVSLAKIPTIRTPHQGLSLLVLGRLHPERGVDNIVELIELLAKEKFECAFDVVGDGPLRQLFEPYVNDEKSPTKVILHGTKNELEVSRFLAKSDLLISFAQEEGYGLALREAVLSGVHVLARRNSGTEEVLSAFPGRVDLIVSASQAFEFIARFSPTNHDLGNLTEIRKAQEMSDAKNVEALVMSWIRA